MSVEPLLQIPDLELPTPNADDNVNAARKIVAAGFDHIPG